MDRAGAAAGCRPDGILDRLSGCGSACVRGGWGAQADGPAGGGRGALFTPVVRGRSGAGFREP